MQASSTGFSYVRVDSTLCQSWIYNGLPKASSVADKSDRSSSMKFDLLMGSLWSFSLSSRMFRALSSSPVSVARNLV
jgi:hypothetical protein